MNAFRRHPPPLLELIPSFMLPALTLTPADPGSASPDLRRQTMCGAPRFGAPHIHRFAICSCVLLLGFDQERFTRREADAVLDPRSFRGLDAGDFAHEHDRRRSRDFPDDAFAFGLFQTRREPIFAFQARFELGGSDRRKACGSCLRSLPPYDRSPGPAASSSLRNCERRTWHSSIFETRPTMTQVRSL